MHVFFVEYLVYGNREGKHVDSGACTSPDSTLIRSIAYQQPNNVYKLK
jgi:hypothetical protein